MLDWVELSLSFTFQNTIVIFVFVSRLFRPWWFAMEIVVSVLGKRFNQQWGCLAFLDPICILLSVWTFNINVMQNCLKLARVTMHLSALDSTLLHAGLYFCTDVLQFRISEITNPVLLTMFFKLLQFRMWLFKTVIAAWSFSQELIQTASHLTLYRVINQH